MHAVARGKGDSEVGDIRPERQRSGPLDHLERLGVVFSADLGLGPLAPHRREVVRVAERVFHGSFEGFAHAMFVKIDNI